MDAHRARRLGPAFLVLAVSGGALLSFVAPLGGRTQDLRSPSASGASGARTHGVTARPAFSWDADEPPPIPASPEEMLQQASDAVMRAYRDGKTRQAVRLRLDQLFDMESLYVKGIEAQRFRRFRGFPLARRRAALDSRPCSSPPSPTWRALQRSSGAAST